MTRMGERLTPREREVLGALCAGEKCSELAARLCVSYKTVETHLYNARIKLGTPTTYSAIYEYVTRYKAGP